MQNIELFGLITMNKSELVVRLSLSSGLTLKKAEELVDAMTSQMSEALAEGRRIEIRGFGSFDLSYRRARTARNPRSGETFQLGGKYFPAFKPGKVLKTEINP
jgi:integration host factor subunit beta